MALLPGHLVGLGKPRVPPRVTQVNMYSTLKFTLLSASDSVHLPLTRRARSRLLTLTSVVGGQIRPRPGALALPRPPLLHRAHAIVVGKTQRVGPSCTQPGALGRGGCRRCSRHIGVVEVRGVLALQQRLEVQAAVDQAVLHAEVVTRGQHLVTRGAREAVEVINQVPSSHHHLRGRDAQVAAGAALHREPPVGTTEGGTMGTHGWVLPISLLQAPLLPLVEIHSRWATGS